ncbi:hypothetical protein E2C01_075537 [Portunus trituberculatus]|uniref:Uncharacterized protein n=1 Tax=Portunus trituberculatus TaxID=210409 RepID=A0A5B7IGD8_PORTR|nr:hypothetical protein [Portunus trituberculatus]
MPTNQQTMCSAQTTANKSTKTSKQKGNKLAWCIASPTRGKQSTESHPSHFQQPENNSHRSEPGNQALQMHVRTGPKPPGLSRAATEVWWCMSTLLINIQGMPREFYSKRVCELPS